MLITDALIYVWIDERDDLLRKAELYQRYDNDEVAATYRHMAMSLTERIAEADDARIQRARQGA